MKLWKRELVSWLIPSWTSIELIVLLVDVILHMLLNGCIHPHQWTGRLCYDILVVWLQANDTTEFDFGFLELRSANIEIYGLSICLHHSTLLLLWNWFCVFIIWEKIELIFLEDLWFFICEIHGSTILPFIMVKVDHSSNNA